MARRSIPSKSLLLALRGPSHLSEQWHCQNTRRTQRFLHSFTLRPAKQEILESGDKLRTPEVNHRRYRDGELVPKPLSRALGMDYPPQSGQNSGLDTRSFAQKREDFASYEKYKVRRKQLYVYSHPQSQASYLTSQPNRRPREELLSRHWKPRQDT